MKTWKSGVILCQALLCIACSQSGSAGTDQGDTGLVVDVADEAALMPDGAVHLRETVGDTGVPLDTLPDLNVDIVAPDLAPACNPGDGCFNDKCSENSDCSSGWCVDHMGEGVCSMICEDECPSGWSCQQIGSGPDIKYVCVSNMANLCRPCATGAACKSPGGAEDVCVDYGAAGSFCGGQCKLDDDCPWGFSCAEALTVDGVATLQCMADAGECPCTDKAVALALSTPCETANESGVCKGKRLCTQAGLALCDALVPKQETCNGEDDNCDGDVDEPLTAGGKYVPLCDDGNDCTEDVCLGAAGCDHAALDGDECKDENPCTVADHCEGGICVGSPVECDDDNLCTDDSCDETGGCHFEANSLACDDGDACTVADQCKEGVCQGVAVDCECHEDSDCAALEDGNMCNGTLVCKTDKLPHLCMVAPESVVVCPGAGEGDGPCVEPHCNPVDGQCSLLSKDDGVACSDKNKCTVSDTCQDGSCVGEQVNCSDGNLCTDDSCAPESGCVHQFNSGECDDLNPCTLSDECSNGMCVGQMPKDCDDGNPCTKDSCGPDGECMNVPLDIPCSDGNACTVNDWCVAGQCEPGAVMGCNDGNVCTDDSCLPQSGCMFVANQAQCDDGSECTHSDMCLDALCMGVVEECNDGNLCTTDECDPLVGCTHKLNSAGCEDGDPCTVADACNLGECLAGPLLDCDDANPCTMDECQAGICQHAAIGGDCDDGNACTEGDTCDEGKCVWTEIADCDDGNPCTADSCSPSGGCGSKPASGPCEDGDLCTVGDFCDAGECQSGNLIPCDDDNPCTADSCDGGLCEHSPVDGSCDDGNPCTDGDVCVAGKCLWTQLSDCDDQNACTTEVCDQAQGCVYTPVPGTCDDADECTLDDQCDAGDCIGGPSPNCDDANACTADSCDPATGCVNEPHEGQCSDNSVCTQTDTCVNGQCVGANPMVCNDDNQCTADTCDAQAGCQFAPLDGQTCDDGDPNTFGDKCAGTQCQGSSNPCGPNLKMDPQQVVPGWTLCYLDKNAPDNMKTAPCYNLFASAGKSYGCWHSNATYPHENVNGTLSNACKSGVQNDHLYSYWGMCCHIFTVCIKNN